MKKDDVEVTCQQCGGRMRQAKKTDRNYGLQFLGVGVVLGGLWLCFFGGTLGLIAGVCLMIGGSRLGYQVRKVWQCPDCGHHFDR